MAVINFELPILILVFAMVCALAAWLLGTFTHVLRNHRYRTTLGIAAFPLSGLMGFVAMLRVELGFFGEWFSAHPIAILVGVAYAGYLLFGFLGCWTAVRIGGRLDRAHTLSVLYSVLENRKKPNAD
jgi:predicted permease